MVELKVAVIGLGIAGLSICDELAARGYEVWGFDQGGAGPRQGSSRGDTRIFRLTPGEGEVYVPMAECALRGWSALENESGVPIISWTGGYMAGPANSNFVRSCISLARRHERVCHILDSKQAAAQTQGRLAFPDDWVICGEPQCGVLRAATALNLLADRAVRRGALLYWDRALNGPIDDTRLRVEESWISFDRVVVSAGPWTPRLLPELAGRLRPEHRVVGWFQPRDGDGAPSLPLICLDDAAGTFGMPTPSGLFKIGLDAVGEAGIDPDAPAAISRTQIASLAESVRRFLPTYDPAPVQTDVCMYTLTDDQNFLVVESERDSNILGFSCCSGHGFKYGPVYGEIVGDWIEGRDSPLRRAFGVGSSRACAVVKMGAPKVRLG